MLNIKKEINKKQRKIILLTTCVHTEKAASRRWGKRSSDHVAIPNITVCIGHLEHRGSKWRVFGHYDVRHQG